MSPNCRCRPIWCAPRRRRAVASPCRAAAAPRAGPRRRQRCRRPECGGPGSNRSRPSAAAAVPAPAAPRRVPGAARRARADAAEFCRGRRAVRPAARGGDRAHICGRSPSGRFEPGRIEFRPAEGAPRDLANRSSHCLGEWTGAALGRRGVASRGRADPARAGGTPRARAEARSRAHPLVRAALETFPGATIAAVRERYAAAEPGAEPAADDPGDGGRLGLRRG